MSCGCQNRTCTQKVYAFQRSQREPPEVAAWSVHASSAYSLRGLMGAITHHSKLVRFEVR